jgi:phosphoenolpyruvate carboxykinase (GTP)
VDTGFRSQGCASQCTIHSRFDQAPSLDPDWDNPDGVPIDAFVFGARRSDTIPLVVEARTWEEGVYKAATMGSETYGRGDREGRRSAARSVRDVAVLRLPRRRLFFALACDRQKGCEATAHLQRELVPHRREWKIRVARLWSEHAGARVDRRSVSRSWSREETALGFEPAYSDLNWTGLDFPPERFAQVMAVDPDKWTKELSAHDELFAKVGSKQPRALTSERLRLGTRLGAQS